MGQNTQPLSVLARRVLFHGVVALTTSVATAKIQCCLPFRKGSIENHLEGWVCVCTVKHHNQFHVKAMWCTPFRYRVCWRQGAASMFVSASMKVCLKECLAHICRPIALRVVAVSNLVAPASIFRNSDSRTREITQAFPIHKHLDACLSAPLLALLDCEVIVFEDDIIMCTFHFLLPIFFRNVIMVRTHLCVFSVFLS